MKVKVIKEQCIGCGACAAIAPEVFEINDEGLSTVKTEVVPKGHEEEAEDAVDSCPTSAIEKED